ncbi:4-hydroxy-tetrahydrodipicolinate synthase [Acrasis kona]|uniref:4-hydroxy-tetrahydrodipicolinate synthase n=1 Tax=Acrasis kona TaxID=1008807 RepID=A0AAW2ZMV9_9EUKA
MSQSSLSLWIKKNFGHDNELVISTFDSIIISQHYLFKKKLLSKKCVPFSNVESITYEGKNIVILTSERNDRLVISTKDTNVAYQMLCSVWHWNNTDKRKLGTSEAEAKEKTDDSKGAGIVSKALGNANVTLNRSRGNRQEINVVDEKTSKEQQYPIKSFTKIKIDSRPYHFVLSGEQTLCFMYLNKGKDEPTTESVTKIVKSIKQKCDQAAIEFDPSAEFWCDRDAISKMSETVAKLGASVVPFGVKPTFKKPTAVKSHDVVQNNELGLDYVNEQKVHFKHDSAPIFPSVTSPVEAVKLTPKSADTTPSTPVVDLPIANIGNSVKKEAVDIESGELVHLNASRPKMKKKRPAKTTKIEWKEDVDSPINTISV